MMTTMRSHGRRSTVCALASAIASALVPLACSSGDAGQLSQVPAPADAGAEDGSLEADVSEAAETGDIAIDAAGNDSSADADAAEPECFASEALAAPQSALPSTHQLGGFVVSLELDGSV